MKFSSCILPFLCRAKPPRRRRRLCGPDVLLVSSSKSLVSVVEKSGGDDGKVEVFLKGILKKPGSPGPVEAGKGRVKWMDYLGKELAEIKEFEPVSAASPHLIEHESNSKHPHVRRCSPLLQQVSSMLPYQVAALAPPVEPRTGSLINEQGLSFCWNTPLESMSSHNIHSHLTAQSPSTDRLSSSSFGGIQLQCYQPLLRRISLAPSSSRAYLRRFRFLSRSKSTGNLVQQTTGR